MGVYFLIGLLGVFNYLCIYLCVYLFVWFCVYLFAYLFLYLFSEVFQELRLTGRSPSLPALVIMAITPVVNMVTLIITLIWKRRAGHVCR